MDLLHDARNIRRILKFHIFCGITTKASDISFHHLIAFIDFVSGAHIDMLLCFMFSLI